MDSKSMFWKLKYRATFLVLRLFYGVRGSLRMERLGSAYGGWFVPIELPTADWIVYSAGTGEDISFDLAMVERFGCSVHAFDPTPRAREFVERQRSNLPSAFHFHPYGLWNRDTTARFYAPRDPRHVSHSIQNLQGTNSYFEGQVKRIGSIMAELGHPRIDLLKLDIEGAEYDVLGDLVSTGIHPRVLCVELERYGFAENHRVVKLLVNCGFRLVHVHQRTLTFTFG